MPTSKQAHTIAPRSLTAPPAPPREQAQPLGGRIQRGAELIGEPGARNRHRLARDEQRAEQASPSNAAKRCWPLRRRDRRAARRRRCVRSRQQRAREVSPVIAALRTGKLEPPTGPGRGERPVFHVRRLQARSRMTAKPYQAAANGSMRRRAPSAPAGRRPDRRRARPARRCARRWRTGRSSASARTPSRGAAGRSRATRRITLPCALVTRARAAASSP